MKIKEIAVLTNGKVLCSEVAADTDVTSACAFDMMSDVLAFAGNENVLITGLVNPQVVRTAVMVDIACIVFVNGKKPDDGMIRLAENYGIVFIVTEMSTYEASGRLWQAGLRA